MSLRLSLAQWSLHRAIFSGRLRSEDFPVVARRDFGIDAVELVSQILRSARPEPIAEIRRRAAGEGVKVLLIMVDDVGDLSHPKPRARKRAVSNHFPWIEAAARLGGHAVRINSGGEGRLPPKTAWLRGSAPELRECIQRCAESCASLAEFARPFGISVLLENHGGLSSNAEALVQVVKASGSPEVGLLPDFGNFPAGVDRYAAVRTMLPHARALSAKTFDFAPDGLETTIDFPRMMGLVSESGYSGYVGIEYEGDRLPEDEGIRRSKLLLDRWINGT